MANVIVSNKPETTLENLKGPKDGCNGTNSDKIKALTEGFTDRIKEHNIVAVIPAFNEERFIGSVVIKARKYARTVIVVDDGSSDSTEEIAQGAGALVVRHRGNRGKGASLNTGFQKAIELNPEAVVLLDGDGQHRPDDIPLMVQPVIEHDIDMVIGSRYLEAKSDIPAYRMVGQKVVTILTNVFSGVPSTDSWSGYRAFSNRALQHIHFREGGWGVDPEFQFQAREHAFAVGEVPIVAIYEEKAKRNPLPHAMKTVNAIIRMVSQHRPLFYFGIAGVTSIMLGMIAGIWVYERYRVLRQLPTGIALLSVMLIILGTLSFFSGIILHSIRALLISFSNHNQE